MAEGDGLLNRCTALKPYRGFESLRLRPLKRGGVRIKPIGLCDSNFMLKPSLERFPNSLSHPVSFVRKFHLGTRETTVIDRAGVFAIKPCGVEGQK